jgi:hypothetical protein
MTAGRRLGSLPPRASSAIIASEGDLVGAEGTAHGQRTVLGQRMVCHRILFRRGLRRCNDARLTSVAAFGAAQVT